MKSKALIGMAVASKFGWAVTAHAGSDHHANAAAPDVQYPSMAMYESQGSESRAVDSMETAAASGGALSYEQPFGSTASRGEGLVGGYVPAQGASSAETRSSMTMADPAPRFDSAGNEVSALDSNSGGIFSESSSSQRAL